MNPFANDQNKTRTIPRKMILMLWVCTWVFVFSFSGTFATHTYAKWYAGNRRWSAYGIQANIWTPSEPVYIEAGGQSSWISTPKPWIQAGWRYYEGWDEPISYAEYCTGIGPDCDEYDDPAYGVQPWGSIFEYKVDHYTSTTWCATIEGLLMVCKPIQSPPAEVQAFSEIHVSSNNDLNTQFSAVKYKTSAGLWFMLDQENWEDNLPYMVIKDEPYYFRNIRGYQLFIPLISK